MLQKKLMFNKTPNSKKNKIEYNNSIVNQSWNVVSMTFIIVKIIPRYIMIITPNSSKRNGRRKSSFMNSPRDVGVARRPYGFKSQRIPI